MGSSSSSWCSGRDRAEEAKEQVGIGMAEATPELEDEALATAPKSPPPTLLPTARAMREALNAAKRKKESAKKTTAVCCVAPSSNEKEEDEAAKRWKAVKAAWEQQLNEVMIRAQQDGNSDGQASQTQTQQRWRQQQQQQQQQLPQEQQQQLLQGEQEEASRQHGEGSELECSDDRGLSGLLASSDEVETESHHLHEQHHRSGARQTPPRQQPRQQQEQQQQQQQNDQQEEPTSPEHEQPRPPHCPPVEQEFSDEVLRERWPEEQEQQHYLQQTAVCKSPLRIGRNKAAADNNNNHASERRRRRGAVVRSLGLNESDGDNRQDASDANSSVSSSSKGPGRGRGRCRGGDEDRELDKSPAGWLAAGDQQLEMCKDDERGIALALIQRDLQAREAAEGSQEENVLRVPRQTTLEVEAVWQQLHPELLPSSSNVVDMEEQPATGEAGEVGEVEEAGQVGEVREG
eukprot:CAMPEP_0206558324 /NCGR_PEP_ID=MMETSP0325_2-20121206/19686_1 /ASSEMBLY_ACC=CAM_ASM_000347 /TAXON_ID=2866 /ORGANISM="Crypthecodinium cohnii, Strain Seligo" /LENGTH=460 /DNA_ID=CAMNT_0054059523 /DNA_START=141 /DNA_END=1519 /DNA_ORIENTATION=+